MSLTWEYSRNQRRHTAYDTERNEVYWVVSKAPMGNFQGKHGYGLKIPYAEKDILTSSNVKDLKSLAEERFKAAGGKFIQTDEAQPLSIGDAAAKVELCRVELETALRALRDAKGESHDEPCHACNGSGNDLLDVISNRKPEPCDSCNGAGRVARSYPMILQGLQVCQRQPLLPTLGGKKGWVSIRPCADEHKGKTFLGWLLGDLAQGVTASFSRPDATLYIELGYHNPAIFVPDLGEVIYGYESWWGLIKDAAHLRQITDADITNVWYLKALRDLEARESAQKA